MTAKVANSKEKQLDDEDFQANFDGSSWNVKWKRKNAVLPDKAGPKKTYSIKDKNREGFDAEVREWIDAGVLVEHDPVIHEKIRNHVPLMAVEQRKGEKIKIRPVFDFRELNKVIENHPAGSIPICRERLIK